MCMCVSVCMCVCFFFFFFFCVCMCCIVNKYIIAFTFHSPCPSLIKAFLYPCFPSHFSSSSSSLHSFLPSLLFLPYLLYFLLSLFYFLPLTEHPSLRSISSVLTFSSPVPSIPRVFPSLGIIPLYFFLPLSRPRPTSRALVRSIVC